MADYIFNTVENQTIATESLIACLNTGTKEAPVWSPIGIRVTSSTAEYDWQKEDYQDILGTTYSDMKKPIITQNFDPWPLSNGDAAQYNIWKDGIVNQNAQAMANKDMLRIHKYAGTANTAVFAERYESCAVVINSEGGEGGGNLSMPITVTYGGNRTIGTVAVVDGAFVYTPETDESGL